MKTNGHQRGCGSLCSRHLSVNSLYAERERERDFCVVGGETGDCTQRWDQRDSQPCVGAVCTYTDMQIFHHEKVKTEQ